MGRTVVQVGKLIIEIETKEANHARPHCHAVYPNKKNPEARASISLDSFEVLVSSGFDQPTLKEIVRLVVKYQVEIWKEWRKYHG